MKTEVVKKFKLDLSAYDIHPMERKLVEGKASGDLVVQEYEMVKTTLPYPLRENYSVWLRTAGMFRNVEDVVEAVCLAKQIRDAEADFLILDEKEAATLRAVVDKHLDLAADGKSTLGGELHEEAICRVANMEEVEN